MQIGGGREKQNQVKTMNKKYYRFVGIYTFTYAGMGMLMPLLGQYLAGIGFSGIQIGIVTATATAVGIGASPFWGYRSHHSKDSMRVVLALCFTAAAIIIGLVFLKNYFVFLLLYAAYTFFQTPIMPLSDAMTLENKIPFGAVRKWGALGFAIGVFVSGQVADALSLAVIFPLCAFGYATAGIMIAYLRKERKKSTSEVPVKDPDVHVPFKQRPEHRANYLILLKNKKLMALFFAAFFICGTNVANNIYFGFLYKDVGGSIAGIGIAFLLMCSSEAPFMAWTAKLEKLLSMEKMILISMVISALRYLWYSTGPSPHLLIGTFFVQGMVNGIVLIEFVHYIAKLVQPTMIGMAMTLYQALASNCSSILCQLVGGIILDRYDGLHVYLFFAVYNTIGVLLYTGFGLYKCKQV
jgi:Major Facilitator Superfamily.